MIKINPTRAHLFLLILLCAGLPPAYAEDNTDTSSVSASNTANFNFVNADIESVIKAIGDYANVTFIIDPRVKGT